MTKRGSNWPTALPSVEDAAAPREDPVVVTGGQRADNNLVLTGGRVNEIARAQINAGVIAQIAVGNGIEEYQIAAPEIGNRGDLRIGVVIAHFFSTACL